jgi:hypothetical protein
MHPSDTRSRVHRSSCRIQPRNKPNRNANRISTLKKRSRRWSSTRSSTSADVGTSADRCVVVVKPLGRGPLHLPASAAGVQRKRPHNRKSLLRLRSTAARIERTGVGTVRCRQVDWSKCDAFFFLAVSLLMTLCASASAATVHYAVRRLHIIAPPSQAFPGYAVPGSAYAAAPPTVHYDDTPIYNDPSKFAGSAALPIQN